MTTESLVLVFAILGSSFWGSWHCAAMCGPIASLVSNRGSLLYYHLGRAISYMTLGAAGGYIGTLLLKSELQVIRLVSGVLFALIIVVMGIQTFKGRNQVKTPSFLNLHRYFTKMSSGFTMGLLSAFLPCGWLYTYLFAAIATKSPLSGILVMGLFWLGGLPALSTLSMFVKKSVQMAPERKQRLSGTILVVAGLYSVFSFYLTWLT